jgi:hypothetical protein
MRQSAIRERLRASTPDRAVELARAAVSAYGRATSAVRPLPDYLVIGAKKGGTTSIVNWLARRPHVLPMFPRLSRRKSPHYFDINYWQGDAWYRGHFPSTAVRAVHARRTGVIPLTGEASPYYLFHPWAAARIKETAPDVRAIAVLREPVSRAFSHYRDRVATGFEDLPTFEQAIAAEPKRLGLLTDEALRDPRAYSFDHDHHTYLARGHYAPQLRRYFDVFGRDRVLVLTMDELARDASAAFGKVQNFLGLPQVDMELRPVNVRPGGPSLSQDTAERLRRHYEPLNAELYDLLGTDLGW